MAYTDSHHSLKPSGTINYKAGHFLILLFLLNSIAAFAQVYPFQGGFSSAFAGSLPPGWTGNAEVYLNHGRYNGKALSGKINSIFTDENAVTPLIGPLTAHSSITFYYRIVDQYIYPSTPTTLYAGDSFTTQISVNGVWHNVLQITDTNHTTSLAFKQLKVFIGEFAGDTVHVQFAFHFGGTGAGYYVDIDTMAVYDDPQSAVNEIENDAGFTIFPNPCTKASGVNISLDNAADNIIEVTDALGRKVYSSSKLSSAETHIAVNWPAGLYFIRRYSQNTITLRKLLVE